MIRSTAAEATSPRIRNALVPSRVFVAAAAVNAIPALWFKYLPTTDGPTHVYNAWLVHRLMTGSTDVLDYFQLNSVPVPNWFSESLMALAMFVVPPLQAERLLLYFYAVFLSFAFWWCIRSLTADTRGVELLILPFVFTLYLHWGVYNFCFGLAWYLVVIGFYIRHGTRLRPTPSVALGVLLLCVYFTHALAFVQCCLAMFLLWTVAFVSDGRWRNRQRFQKSLADAARVFAAASPSLALMGWFTIHHRDPANPTSFGTPHPTIALLQLASLQLVRIFEVGDTSLPLERFTSLSAAALLWGGTIWLLWHWRRPDRTKLSVQLFVVAAAGAAICLFGPSRTSGMETLGDRQMYFVVLPVLLWIGAQRLGPRARTAAGVAAVVIAAGLHVSRWRQYEAYEEAVTRFVSATGDLPIGGAHTLLAYSFGRWAVHVLGPSGEPTVSGHAGGYIAVERNLLLLSDHAVGRNFPLVQNPKWATIGAVYTKWPNAPVDVFLLWGDALRPAEIAATIPSFSREFRDLRSYTVDAGPPGARAYLKSTPGIRP